MQSTSSRCPTKILPHNFNELIDASVAHLKGKKFQIFPDFITGGMLDVSNYNDGERGGRIRARARIIQKDKNTLCITELPFGKNTSDLIDPVIKANEKGKIKIKKIEDNTSDQVEINIFLANDHGFFFTFSTDQHLNFGIQLFGNINNSVDI